jgi:alcohol dehydrogenase (cytochrome c)
LFSALSLVPLTAASQVAADSARAGANVPHAPAFDGATLAARPGGNWITNGGNVFNQRYSTLNAINRENVGNLRPIWRADLGDSGNASKYSGQGQPVVYDGVIYIPTGANDVFAIDAATGAILWSYAANLDEKIDSICCGWLSRGVALGDGRVYVGQLDGKLVALDQSTGRVVWSTQAERWEDGFSITAAPLYFDGLVITGFAGGDRASRGRVKAFDAASGALRWTFYTVPGPGEFGHDSWPQDNDAWAYGGAAVWQTPAVDPALGLVYFSTGNPGPDLNGSVRPGDNLFSVSIVALEARTGRYRWHFQQVHHDIWDYDSPNPVVLFDAVIDGRLRKGLVEVSKTGFAYILDRETGRPLIGIEERPVPQEPRQATAPTQPYPIGEPIVPQEIDIAPLGWELVNQGRIFTPFWTTPTLVKPRATGGANWPPSSFDPQTNTLYVCAHDGISAYSTTGEEQFVDPEPGGGYAQGTFGRPDVRIRGIFAALDVTTNRLRWRQQWPDMCYSGSIVTGGGLVFVGQNDGRLMALDKSNGAVLWEYQTDAGVNATASTFMHEDRQYVAVLAAGTFYPGTPRGDGLWLFGLDAAAPGSSLPPLVSEEGELTH